MQNALRVGLGRGHLPPRRCWPCDWRRPANNLKQKQLTTPTRFQPEAQGKPSCGPWPSNHRS
eukprot:3213842-Pyramimonas_sp.AAC.1